MPRYSAAVALEFNADGIATAHRVAQSMAIGVEEAVTTEAGRVREIGVLEVLPEPERDPRARNYRHPKRDPLMEAACPSEDARLLLLP